MPGQERMRLAHISRKQTTVQLCHYLPGRILHNHIKTHTISMMMEPTTRRRLCAKYLAPVHATNPTHSHIHSFPFIHYYSTREVHCRRDSTTKTLASAVPNKSTLTHVGERTLHYNMIGRHAPDIVSVRLLPPTDGHVAYIYAFTINAIGVLLSAGTGRKSCARYRIK